MSGRLLIQLILSRFRCFCRVCKGNRRQFRRQRQLHAEENGLMSNNVIDFTFEPAQVVTSNDNSNDDTFEREDSNDDDIEDVVNDNDVEHDCSNSDSSEGDEDGGKELLRVDDPKSTLNPLTRFLFNFATRFALSDKAMAALMQGLTSVDCTGGFYLPKDFRTVERAVTRSEQGLHDEGTLDLTNDDDDTLISTTGVSVLYVCSNCNLHEFEADKVKAKKPCPQCGVTSVRCGYQRCKSFCIATSTLGNKSINQLTICSYCKQGPLSHRTTRLYFLSLENHVKRFFRNNNACLDALAPFSSSLYTIDKPSRRVVTDENWLDRWKSDIKALNYKSENWHGERFYNHPVWKEHGVRSVLLSLFIDWFPPFKKKDYSIGVISCSVMNLSCDARGSGFHVWPLAILEGPAQLHSTYVPLRKLCESFESFYNDGIRVFDALTNSFQTIHGVVAQIIADSPALAKIGMHNGHGSYFCCHRCGHKGVVCGCDAERPTPIRYDNINFHPRNMKELDRVTLSGVLRTSSKKEHIVFLETDLIKQENLREDTTIKSEQFRVWNKLHNRETRSWSDHKMKKWMSRFRVKGLSPLVHIPHLSLVHDLPTEAMHAIIKGILLQLAEYTFSERDKFRSLPSNINAVKSNVNTFLARMQRFKLPQGVDTQSGLSTHVHFAKADPLYSFLRVQALIALEGLVSPRTYEIWRLMSIVACALLHTHNPKSWFEQDLAHVVSELMMTFKAEFGECAMRPNWHLLLHCRIDYNNWSTARSHWSFAGERLCGALIRQVRNTSLSKITQSIVRTTQRAMCALKGEIDDPSNFVRPIRRKCSAPLLPDGLRTQTDIFLKMGYSYFDKGLGFHKSSWKVGDLSWVCDYSSNTVTPTQRLFKIVGILRHQNDEHDKKGSHVLVLQCLDQVRQRSGYNNVFHWAALDPLQPVGLVLDTSVPCESKHMCEVATYASSEAGSVLIPICGNLPF